MATKNIYEVFLSFALKKFVLLISILLVPQFINYAYTLNAESKGCLGTTTIEVSKSIKNPSLIGEVLFNDIKLENINGVRLVNSNIIIKFKDDKKNCQIVYKQIEEIISKANTRIEEFYVNLSPAEQSAFADPILFKEIAGIKIKFANLVEYDEVTYAKKKKTLRIFYTLFGSLLIIFIIFFIGLFREYKSKLFKIF